MHSYKNQQDIIAKTELPLNTIICGNCSDILSTLPDNSIDLVITSPPYFQQREYGSGGIGNEFTIDDYISNLIEIFIQCIRVTKDTGSIVFNLGDKYIDGNLLLIPFRFALEVQKIESNVETIKGNIHPAVYPEYIIQEIMKLLSKENDIVLDPFLGSGTTAVVAQKLRRHYIGIEIHKEYVEYAEKRLAECRTSTIGDNNGKLFPL